MKYSRQGGINRDISVGDRRRQPWMDLRWRIGKQLRLLEHPEAMLGVVGQECDEGGEVWRVAAMRFRKCPADAQTRQAA